MGKRSLSIYEGFVYVLKLAVAQGLLLPWSGGLEMAFPDWANRHLLQNSRVRNRSLGIKSNVNNMSWCSRVFQDNQKARMSKPQALRVVSHFQHI